MPPSPRSFEPARILFYSHDGFGLGHLRRNLKLAESLTRELPDASAVLVAGLPGTPGFDLPPGIDLVKLPAIRKVATDRWEARQLRVEIERLQALRRAILDGVFTTFVPHLVVVDYLPLGVWGELREPLTRLRREQPAAVVALGLRDVLDAPLVTRRSWRNGGHDHAVRSLYDVVQIYGDCDLYDSCQLYGLDELAPGRVFFTGYVCSGDGGGDAATERDKLGLAAREELVLVTAGGGADAFPMMQLAVEACRRLAERGRRIRTLVVTGPLMTAREVAELERLAAGCAITVQRWRADLEATMAAANVIVTMAAYNTLTEAVRSGRPVISIPRPGPSAEQTTRAGLFAARGLLSAMPPHATADDLARTLTTLLRSELTPARPPAMDGLENATACLRALLVGATAAPPQEAQRVGRLA
jgi:predicted glycosyltransferase